MRTPFVKRLTWGPGGDQPEASGADRQIRSSPYSRHCEEQSDEAIQFFGLIELLREVCNSPEIIQDDVQIGFGRGLFVQAGVDDPAAGFDRRMIPEVVRCLQYDPGGIGGFVGGRFIRGCGELLACGCAEWDCIHLRYSPAIPDR